MSIVTAAAGNICIYAPAIPNDHTKVCNYTDIQNIMVSILYFLAYHLQVSEQNCGQISNIYLMNTNKITHTHTHTFCHTHWSPNYLSVPLPLPHLRLPAYSAYTTHHTL